ARVISLGFGRLDVFDWVGGDVVERRTDFDADCRFLPPRARSRGVPLGTGSAIMPGMNFPYQIKRTGSRSRSISVRVHGDGTVRVGAPDWVRLAEIRDVVAEHSAWIAERLAAGR